MTSQPIPKIESDDHELEKLLNVHVECLVSHGSWFSTDLVIAVHQGELSVKSASGRTDRRGFIRVPLNLMPFKRDYAFFRQGDGLECRVVNPEADFLQVRLMEQMTAIYNLCAKIKSWEQVNPFLALQASPAVLEKLLQAKKNAPKVKSFKALIAANEMDTLVVDSFLGSRTFNMSARFLNVQGHADQAQVNEVFLPAIDCLNHRFQAENFAIQPEPEPPGMVISGRPDPETGELFVRYNLYDPLDTFLFYGFVDSHSPWIASVPIQLELPDGKVLDVAGTGGVIKKQLPPAVKDLRGYIPMVIGHDGEVIRINKLLIPGSNAPRALQRVLGMLLQGLDYGLDRTELLQWITKLETRIIQVNQQWWNELAIAAQENPLSKEIRKLCDFSRNHLQNYLDSRHELSD